MMIQSDTMMIKLSSVVVKLIADETNKTSFVLFIH